MKKVRINSILFFSIICLLVVFQVSIFASSGKTQYSFSTGNLGGGFYAIGAGMADYLSRNIENISCTAVTSGGVVENMNRIQFGKADFGLTTTIASYQAFRGLSVYEQEYDNMRQLGIMWPSWGQPYTLKKSGIETYLDLKGKVVCAGNPGGSMDQLFFDFVRIHGIDPEKDFKKVVYLPLKAAMEALKTGQVDAVMTSNVIPDANIVELSLTRDVNIVRFAPGYRDKLVKEKPEYSPMTLPGGTYRGVDEDIETVGLFTLWVCNKDIPDEIAYQAVKAVYSPEGLDYLRKVHVAAKNISLKGAASAISLPLHPGAEKYYKEVGLIK